MNPKYISIPYQAVWDLRLSVPHETYMAACKTVFDEYAVDRLCKGPYQAPSRTNWIHSSYRMLFKHRKKSLTNVS